MAEELDANAVEHMSRQAVSRFINSSSKKKGIVTFDLKADGYVYKITYRLNAAGDWKMTNYTSSLLR
jgi:hypothetical protein